ncbi:MAG: glutamate-1-semialdehyde aminotransferase [Spirochaetia bacterium]|nr:glutamate-1-semialdehyde aminotransferase [Spirochaetia bacterium]
MQREGKETRHERPEGYTMPTVVRARSFYLYDGFGARYTDFFQNYGRAILGHRPDLIQRSIKSTVSRGLVSEYPSVFSGRLEKLLATLFPDFPVIRMYSDPQKVLQAIRSVSGDVPFDPATSPEHASRTVSYWRPYLGFGGADSVMLLPILPFPGSFVPQVVCLKEEACTGDVPPSDAVSPLLLDLLVKTTANLIRSLESDETVKKRMDNPLAGVFETRGPYGLTGLSPARYEAFALEALSLKVVLPPTADVPFIIPGEYAKGDVRPFLELAGR